MLKLSFANVQESSLRQILCLGAHSDDIEIGCGATILKLIETYPDVQIYWVVFAASGIREQEAFASANLFLNPIPTKKILLKSFRDGFFPYVGWEIKEFFETLKREVAPDLIFTHYHQDAHQDHRLISELTWNTFRDHFILEYEIPKYEGDLGNPNFFVQLHEGYCQQKVAYLLESFGTQRNKQWFTTETFAALLRLRGIQCNAPEKYAEAFYCRKAIV
jgi:LmbE family N-acetylglucosaminyl deacetylase